MSRDPQEIREDGLRSICRCEEGRREFLREATALVAGALAALGASPEDARAFPVRRGDPIRGDQQEVAYPLPAADGATIDAANKVILVRYQDRVCAFARACPHQGGALGWLGKENRFKCPRHGSEFQPDGAFISGRARRNMDRFPIRRNDAGVMVDLAKPIQSDKDKAAWDGAVVVL